MAIMAAAIVICLIPNKPIYLGFIPRLNAVCGVVFCFYMAMRGTAQLLAKTVVTFEPRSGLAAKRANEQIKLISTTVNSVALATAAAFAITEYAKETEPNYLIMMMYLTIALDFHHRARALLGLLKDENVSLPLD
jgi:hypothetical protein